MVLSPEASIRRDRRRFGQRRDAEKICAPPQSLTSQQQEKQGRRPLPCSERRTVVPWGVSLTEQQHVVDRWSSPYTTVLSDKNPGRTRTSGQFLSPATMKRLSAKPAEGSLPQQTRRTSFRTVKGAGILTVGRRRSLLAGNRMRPPPGTICPPPGTITQFFFSRLSLARFRRTTPLQKAWHFSFHNPRQSKCSRDQIGHWSDAKGRASIKNCVTIRSNITGHVQCVLGRDRRDIHVEI